MSSGSFSSTKQFEENGGFHQAPKDFSFIPYLFIIFFGIIFAVDILFIYLANKSWTGTSTDNAYQKGLKYNQTLEYVKKQQELGWDSQIEYTKLYEKQGTLSVNIKNNNKQLIKNASIIAKFTRPVQEGFDFTSKLQFDEKKSNYSNLINFPLKGQWDVEIQVTKDDIVYQKATRLIVY